MGPVLERTDFSSGPAQALAGREDTPCLATGFPPRLPEKRPGAGLAAPGRWRAGGGIRVSGPPSLGARLSLRSGASQGLAATSSCGVPVSCGTSQTSSGAKAGSSGSAYTPKRAPTGTFARPEGPVRVPPLQLSLVGHQLHTRRQREGERRTNLGDRALETPAREARVSGRERASSPFVPSLSPPASPGAARESLGTTRWTPRRAAASWIPASQAPRFDLAERTDPVSGAVPRGLSCTRPYAAARA